mmetsp:Transcript_21801/g.44188  ORF Transcript_21801/g.44188 Transcript_21801/m.44188 type:complete len:165 (-) Transcript_21801:229-723(-)|eukprot:CAMPEP_0181304612 /NCGR_PEP_ID=MMETSP1101-20121128/9250_1 /TAXON_ID=46948 /ORGANISM="Rhodomonas abbreviata, Strain Caron Lab Isolate" /LENGTH=164 /DNA_ID=CAMNT_0023410395 /DNA_START=95 /DNA_END=589 /DNA_ORIENTATION=-
MERSFLQSSLLLWALLFILCTSPTHGFCSMPTAKPGLLALKNKVCILRTSMVMPWWEKNKTPPGKQSAAIERLTRGEFFTLVGALGGVGAVFAAGSGTGVLSDKLDVMDKKIDGVEKKIDGVKVDLEKRIDGLETKTESVGSKVDDLFFKVGRLEGILDRDKGK